MAKSKQLKQNELDVLNDKFNKSKSVVFANYMGLTVNEVQELRRELRKEKNEMVVAKKTLLGLMLEKAGLSRDAMNTMDGGVAVVFGYGDEVSPAKVVATFAKKHEMVALQAGVLEGALIDAAAVNQLSQLPSKNELLAKMVGSLKSPLSGMVNVLAGNLRGLVQVLNQVKEQKQSANS